MAGRKILEGKYWKEMQQINQEATKYIVAYRVLYRRQKTNDPLGKVFLGTEKRRIAIETVHATSGYCGREGMLHKVVKWYWWQDIYGNIKGWVKECEQCKKSAHPRYDKPLTSLPVSHLCQQVGMMNILSMPKMENWHQLLQIAREYHNSWVVAPLLC